MRSYSFRFCLVVLLSFHVQATSSENSSYECLECPINEYVGGSRTCDSTSPTRNKRRVAGWIEFPVVEWTCAKPDECEPDECASCTALVEVRLYVGCLSHIDYRAPMGYGFPLDYADPLFDFSLIDYFEPAGVIRN